MKRTLLLGGLLAAALAANAQQRLVLYEEFSGENCFPCAVANPGLMDTLTNNPNASKIMLIKYQTPIPSGGPIYQQNVTDVNARTGYYNVPFAPYGRMDGDVSPGAPAGSQNAGHVSYLTKAHIATAVGIASPFNITVTNTVTGTNISSTINVTAVAAYSGLSVKLRAALVESLNFATPPGTNGETSFHHVVRKMYPSADGQSIPATWTNGQTGTYTFTGTIPSYVDRTNQVFLVVWIQNDGDKKVAQAAKSVTLPLPAVDGSITAAVPANASLYCVGGPQQHKVTLKNTGTSTMTSAQIYYKVNLAAYQTYNWTGSLAPGASTEVAVGNVTLVSGTTTITDSVGNVNGQADINPANSVYSATVISHQTPAAMPVASSFENGLANGWSIMDNNNNLKLEPEFRGETWFTFSDAQVKAYDGTWTAIASCSDMTVGNKTTLVTPLTTVTAGAKALDFYYATALRAGVGDKLEVVYSTDCGDNWTSVWSKSNADLANNPATQNTLFVPTATSNYRMVSVDMSAMNANALVGIRATSGGGNYIFLDKVNLRTGQTTVIEELVSGGNAVLYPNPVADQVTVELNMVKAAKVTFQMVNMLGQQVGQSLVKDLKAGQTNTSVNTSDLAPGIYFMNVITDKGNLQQKFVKN